MSRSLFRKQHYDALAMQIDKARCLRSSPPAQEQALTALAGFAWSLARVLAADNPNFDTMRFLEACGFSNMTEKGK